jgi:hypothetical protein
MKGIATMKTAVLLCRSDTGRQALEEFVTAMQVVDRNPVIDLNFQRVPDLRLGQGLVQFPESDYQDARTWFPVLVSQFTRLLEESREGMVVLVDEVFPLELNPLINRGIDSLLALLILAFPEVAWHFGFVRGYAQQTLAGSDRGGSAASELNTFYEAHSIGRILEPLGESLFDGSGLRQWVYRRMRDGQPSSTLDLPQRLRIAIALDDEWNYACFNAYTAFRFGVRAF